MPNKNKQKGNIKIKSKNIKRAKSVLPKKSSKQTESSETTSNKNNKNKGLLSKKKNKKKYIINKRRNFLSSIRQLTTINNELDFLSSDLNIKFKINNYDNNILFKDNNHNKLFDENKINFKINSYLYDKNKFRESYSSINNNRRKAMDNLYLYKQNNRNLSYKIYRQPEIIASRPINRFKLNSVLNFKNLGKIPNINSYKMKNIIYPSMPSFFHNPKKKFNINNINNACKIMLEKD